MLERVPRLDYRKGIGPETSPIKSRERGTGDQSGRLVEAILP
jgi:hypothetical protein